MRLVTDPDHVIRQISDTTGHNPDFVRSVVADLRHVIDSAVGNDVTVVVPPLVFRRRDEPILPAVEKRFTHADWREPLGLKALDPKDLAAEIGVCPEQLEDYPILFGTHMLMLLFDQRGVDWEADAGDAIADVFYAWRSTFATPTGELSRPYEYSHVGLEGDFEDWLAANLHALSECGYPVELESRQHRFAFGGIADMVCRVTRDDKPLREGDYVVIENKATPVDLPALEQLTGYVDALRAELPGEAHVFGVLISDGTTVRLQEQLGQRGLGFLSLTSLGYRDLVYREQRLTSEPDESFGTVCPVQPFSAPVAMPQEEAHKGSGAPFVATPSTR